MLTFCANSYESGIIHQNFSVLSETALENGKSWFAVRSVDYRPDCASLRDLGITTSALIPGIPTMHMLFFHPTRNYSLTLTETMIRAPYSEYVKATDASYFWADDLTRVTPDELDRFIHDSSVLDAALADGGIVDRTTALRIAPNFDMFGHAE